MLLYEDRLGHYLVSKLYMATFFDIDMVPRFKDCSDAKCCMGCKDFTRKVFTVLVPVGSQCTSSPNCGGYLLKHVSPTLHILY